MHKGIILLLKSLNKEGVKNQVNEFMTEYKDNIWDWYVIGGRWSGTLNKNKKIFYEKIKEKNIKTEYMSDIEKEDTQIALQEIWESLGEKSINPVCRDSFLSYSNRLYLENKEEVNDDVLPLKDCIDIVKDWSFDYIERGKEEEQEAKDKWLQRKNEKTGEIFDDYNMYGYCLKIAANIYQQNFCFDCNIFNVEKYNYSIPDDIENYYAVMIDIHH